MIFETNNRDSFKKLKAEHRLFDVTFVSDDGQQIQAHKMILSAGSDFFSDVFVNKLIGEKERYSSHRVLVSQNWLTNHEAFQNRGWLVK